MKRIMAIAIIAILSTLAFGQRIDEIVKGTVSKAAGELMRQTVDRGVQGDVSRSIDRANLERNRENGFRLPDGTVLGFEMKSNSTRFDDEKILAAIKAEAKHWGRNLGLGSSFNDRQTMKDRNNADADNKWLRNPNRKGRMERPSYDVYVTAREARGDQMKGGDFGRYFRTFLSGNYFTAASYMELTIEFKEAESQVANADAAFAVIGGNLRSSRLSLDTNRFSIQSGSDDDSDQDLRNSTSNLTKVMLNGNRGRQTRR